MAKWDWIDIFILKMLVRLIVCSVETTIFFEEFSLCYKICQAIKPNKIKVQTFFMFIIFDIPQGNYPPYFWSVCPLNQRKQGALRGENIPLCFLQSQLVSSVLSSKFLFNTYQKNNWKIMENTKTYTSFGILSKIVSIQ